MRLEDYRQFFQFRDGQLHPISEHSERVRLAAADSFLIEDGMVRGLEAHFNRFADWVREVDGEANEQLDGFFSEIRMLLPLTGRWFPRLEYHGEADAGKHLYLRLRKAPKQLTDMSLWTYPKDDPRSMPSIKGPDLSLMMQLRRHAMFRGADETVLLNQNGHVLEGALSGLVWWRGNVLCAPMPSKKRLDSITTREVLTIAEQMDFEIGFEAATPGSLAGCEIWGLSSLHGIRPVTSWLDLGAKVGEVVHAENFQKRLRLFSQSVD